MDVNIANIGTYYCWGVQLDIVIRHCIIEKHLQTFNVYFVALESKWLNNGVYEKYRLVRLAVVADRNFLHSELTTGFRGDWCCVFE